MRVKILNFLAATAALLAGTAAQAHTSSFQTGCESSEARVLDEPIAAVEIVEPDTGFYPDASLRVKRISGFSRYDSFSVVDRDTIIVWLRPSQPYLVELSGGSSALKFRHAIGFTSTQGTLTTFDSVVVDGRRLPIRAIYKLDRAQARAILKMA